MFINISLKFIIRTLKYLFTIIDPYLISNVQSNVLNNDIHSPSIRLYFPQINQSNSLSQYALWQKSADVTNELDLNGIITNTPIIEKTKTCHIDVSINSIQDLLSIVDTHSFQSDTEYNIDLEVLHKIKPELTSLNNMIGMDTMKHSVVNQLLYFIQNLHLGNKMGDFKHTVIYGPPGTGKSQTLTAIITTALSNKKKVLVVCEKRTALEVIYSNIVKKYPLLSKSIAIIEDVTKDRNSIVKNVRERETSTQFEQVRQNDNNIKTDIEYLLTKNVYLKIDESVFVLTDEEFKKLYKEILTNIKGMFRKNQWGVAERIAANEQGIWKLPIKYVKHFK